MNIHALLHIFLCCLRVAIVVAGVITAKIRSWLFAVAAIDGVWRFVEQRLLLWNKISWGDVNWWRLLLLHGDLTLLSDVNWWRLLLLHGDLTLLSVLLQCDVSRGLILGYPGVCRVLILLQWDVWRLLVHVIVKCHVLVLMK